jgi:sugar O-acyltransferase (sialic acid O-acetyltransferase NeuD family)
MKFIYSNGGFAREFIRCVRDRYDGERVIVVDDAESAGSIGYDAARNLAQDDLGEWIVGFANGELRKRKMERILEDGFSFFSVISSTSIIGDRVTIGEGAVLSDYSMVTADAKIGRGFQCNIYSYIAHDCIVGDYVTLAPRVSVNGRVVIEDNVYIGTGAIILPGNESEPLVIGNGAVVGAHALVTKNVDANTTVIGMPAKSREIKC